jgi:hypothetical protein
MPTTQEKRKTYCSKCGVKFEYLIEVNSFQQLSSDRYSFEWKDSIKSHLNTTPCPNCQNIQEEEIELEDLKFVDITDMSEKDVLMMYLNEKSEERLREIDREISEVDELIEIINRNIENNKTEFTLLKEKVKFISGSELFGEEVLKFENKIKLLTKQISRNINDKSECFITRTNLITEKNKLLKIIY